MKKKEPLRVWNKDSFVFEDDRLSLVIAFIRVAEKLSFSAATEGTDVHSSTLSRRISRLEDSLGVRLLNRTTRSVSLTEPGRLYLAECLTIVETMASADAMVSAFNEGPRGLLRISVPVAFGQRHMSRLISKFLEQNSEIQIEANFTDRFVDVVAEEYDLVIRTGMLQDSGLVVRKLAENRRLLVATPGYMVRYGTPNSPQDLQRHNCLRYTKYPSAWRFQHGDYNEEISVTGSLLSDSSEAVLNAILDGVGIGVVAEYMCYDKLASGQLVSLLPEFMSGQSAAIYAAFPSRRHLPLKTRSFIEFLAEKLREPEWRQTGASAASKTSS